MIKTVHGRVHGKTIELSEDLGVAKGQEVEIQIKLILDPPSRPGEGFLRAEGALAEDDERDGIMEEISQARKLGRGTPVPDLSPPRLTNCFEIAKQSGLIGCVDTNVGDLSASPKHMEDFGK